MPRRVGPPTRSQLPHSVSSSPLTAPSYRPPYTLRHGMPRPITVVAPATFARHVVPMSQLLSAMTVTVTVLALFGCRSVSDLGPPSGFALPSGDVVVIGRLENLNSEFVHDPDDLLGHGWFSGNLHVSRIESGELPSRVVRVRYFGHTWLRDDVTFRFHLRADEGGGYLICSRPGGSGVNCDLQSRP